VKMPVAGELRAAWSPTQIARNRLPGGPAVAFHIIKGDLVGDALVAQYRDQPIEQRGRIPGADRRMNAFGRQRFASIIDKRRRAGDLAIRRISPVAWSSAARSFARGRLPGSGWLMLPGSIAVKSSPPACAGRRCRRRYTAGWFGSTGWRRQRRGGFLSADRRVFLPVFPPFNCSSMFETQLTIAITCVQARRAI
jgi:hypothetical protein